MTVQSIPQTTYNRQPATTFGTNNKEIKAGHFVVNPPTIRPYTFYDKIKVDREFYNELVNPKSKAFIQKETIKQERLKGVLKTIAILGSVFIVINCRKNIQKFLTETINSIKLCLKSSK